MAMPIIKQLLNSNESIWYEATLNSGISPSGDNFGGHSGIRYKKIGNHVYIQGSVSFNYTGGTLIFTNIPEGYRPNGVIYIITPLTGLCIARISVGSGGNFYLEWIKNIADGTDYKGAISWMQINIDYFIN